MVEQSGSLLASLFLWLTAPAPAWLLACLLAAVLVLLMKQRTIVRRLNSHADSIGHMDVWADEVDEKVSYLEERATYASAANRTERLRSVEAERWRP